MPESGIQVFEFRVEGGTSLPEPADLNMRVERALAHVRPFLHVDGGGVELVRIEWESRVVEVRLLGACQSCSLSQMTLRAGVERAILHEAPEILRVEAVSHSVRNGVA